MNKNRYGFTLIEILLSIGILGILLTLIINSYATLSKTQAVEKDTHAVVAFLAQARSQTLSSKNATQYGVHIASTSVTLFTGSSYNSSDSTNQIYLLNSNNQIKSISLTGGGNDVIFTRLTGETADDGSFQVSAMNATSTKTVTVYKTGLAESN